MKSSTMLPLAIALALGSAPALALQLGEVRVKSALDEPLVAEIPIQLDNLSEARDLRAGLASQADFDKAGISRAGLDQLRFSIVDDSTGHKLVLITSQQPVSDPYLDFLIEVDNASGKQLREYTVLLDPVISTPPPEQEMIAPASAPPQAAPAPTPPAPATMPVNPAPMQQTAAPTPPPAAPPPPPANPVQSTTAHAGDYTVQRGDTLYRIASENRPDDQVSVDQMMLALQSSNPDAFYHDNINNLKSGAILRIPTRDEIASAPGGAKAHAQVRRQNEDWRGVAARKATVVASEAAGDQGAPAKSATDAGDKLALVPPTKGGGSAATRAGEQGGTGAEQVAGLKQQLATTKESLASAKQENSELQSRVKDLEDISGKNQKLLGMKDAQIAELQGKLTKLQNGPGAASSAAAAVPAPAGSANAAVTKAATAGAPTSPAGTVSAPAASAGTAGTVAANAPAKSAPVSRPVAAKPQPASRPSAAATEALPWYQRPVAWIVAGAVLLVLILAGLLRRRPKPLPELPEEPEASSLADHFGDSPLPDAQADVAEADEPHDPAAQEPEPEPEPEAAPAVQDYDFTFDEPPPGEPVAEPGMPPPQAPMVELDDITRERSAVGFEESAPTSYADASGEEEVAPASADEFSDDPVDTKLDLARAYLDMGDPAGARAMLEEVLNEGTQAQKGEAGRLLDDMA